jgi:hypothetical protein
VIVKHYTDGRQPTLKRVPVPKPIGEL